MLAWPLGSALSPAQEPKDVDVLIEKRTATLPAWAEDSFRRVDAGYDGWRSEVLHDSAKPILKKLVAALGNASLPFPKQGIAPDFAAFTRLRPQKLSPMMDRAGIEVLRPSDWGAGSRYCDRATGARLPTTWPGSIWSHPCARRWAMSTLIPS